MFLIALGSYSYDPTHTLQYNLAPDFGLPTKLVEKEPEKEFSQFDQVETQVFEKGLDTELIKPEDGTGPNTGNIESKVKTTTTHADLTDKSRTETKTNKIAGEVFHCVTKAKIIKFL